MEFETDTLTLPEVCGRYVASRLQTRADPLTPFFFFLLLTRVTFASSCPPVFHAWANFPAWLYSSLCHPAPLLETVRSTTTMMGSQLRNIPCNCKSPCISTLEGSRSRQNPFESFLHSLSVSAHCLLGCILQAV